MASRLDEPSARRRWLRDAKLAQQLVGDHVLRILDVGDSRGIPFLVRERSARTLAEEIRQRGPIPIARGPAGQNPHVPRARTLLSAGPEDHSDDLANGPSTDPSLNPWAPASEPPAIAEKEVHPETSERAPLKASTRGQAPATTEAPVPSPWSPARPTD